MLKLRAFLSLILIFSSSLALACEFKEVTFERDFSGARLNACEQLSKYEYRLTIKPENTPINSSAWYSFKAHAAVPQQIRITLIYEDGKHRYQPKVSDDGEHWQLLAHTTKDETASFDLFVSKQPVWVSAQELLDVKYMQRWLKTLADKTGFEAYELGKSTQERAIWAIESRAETDDWLILVGRQHPPEVTGALAMLPFVETTLSNLSVANAFRQRFNILIVPMLNPDGVELGNWRHNVGGVDLNRDWKDFKQAETRLVKEKLDSIIAKGGKIRFAVDFHSTWKNLFYTMPVDYGLESPKLSQTWLDNLAKVLPNFEVDIRPGSSPGRGVFKQYISDTYGVHAVTYEVGDHANRNEITIVGKTSALLLMKLLLAEQVAYK